MSMRPDEPENAHGNRHPVNSKSRLPDEITIHFRDLTPEIQDAVKIVSRARGKREVGELAFMAGLAFALNEYIHDIRGQQKINAIITGAGLVIRQSSVADVQDEHEKIAKKMKRDIVGKNTQGHHPQAIDPETLIKTHPVFVVKGNGDIVLMRQTSAENTQYQKQKGIIGHLGLNTWRWRGHLRPLDYPTGGKRIRTLTQRIKEFLNLPEPRVAFLNRSPAHAHRATRAPARRAKKK